ncbi:hypothetical protein [Caldimonas tepidiphila]|uniref:hypothetical protein n=1 Tax=Caldimonas tepidiphila TaxID=2315841 RepID=UPI0013007E77|nr:hypothetical protein [Caldimonas tepidiphila]
MQDYVEMLGGHMVHDLQLRYQIDEAIREAQNNGIKPKPFRESYAVTPFAP